MQAPEHSRPARSRSVGAAAAGWTAIGLPLLVVLASFLGGATQRWSEAIVIGCFALLLLARPPRFSLGPILNTLALLFAVLAAVAFLPARWFLAPDWRVALTNDFGMQLAPTLSPQPWLTLDCLLMLVAGVAWIYYVATLDADLRDIRRATRVFSGGTVALAGLCLFLHLTQRTLPFWHNVRAFGPYPNRNQTGDLFGISTLVVLACMQDDFRRGRKRWIIWLAGLGVLVAALILNFSRAGILILVIGVAAWLVRLALRKWSGAGIAVAASLLLVLFTALLLFGGETIERFHLRLGSEGAVTSDYRWLIFRDTWTLIKASPWCGIGLGNFESVFALFRDISHGESRSLHPESDWLWVWTEMGWPAVAIILLGAALLVRRAFPLKEGSNQRLRYAALVGAILFALHGLVDVSGHRFGTFLAATFLLGLAQFRPPSSAPRRWPSIVFRLLGVLLAVAGATWLSAWRRDLPLPGYVGVENVKRSATFATHSHQFRDAISLSNRGLQWAPLDWQLYFLRAVARIGLRQPPARALADFRRARFLEPNAYQLPFEEGKTWLGSQPILALTAWREALRRYGSQPEKLYSQMFPIAGTYDPAVHQALGQLAENRPSLTITYLENISGPEFQAALRELLVRDPKLQQFDFAQKTKLFALWSSRDPLDELVRAVSARPEWTKFAWPGIARDHASRQEFEEAWNLVRRYAPQPELPRAAVAEPIPQREQKLYANPNDYAAGYALYRAQIAAGKTDDALATIRHFTARPDTPNYFYYLQAQAWAAKENWQRAWQSWQDYRSASGQH
jgi:O-antigen ligase